MTATNEKLTWREKAFIGGVGGVCLSLLKLIDAKFHIGVASSNEALAAYCTYLAYVFLGIIVASFFSDMELPKPKQEKNALLLGLLAPSILIAVVTKPVNVDVSTDQLRDRIPELGSLFFNSAVAGEMRKEARLGDKHRKQWFRKHSDRNRPEMS